MAGEVLQFPLRLGLAEDANPKAKPVSSLKTGANIRWVRDGQIGKRFGTNILPTALAGGGNLAGLQRFVLRGDELSVTDGRALYTYNAPREEWRTTPDVAEVSLSWRNLIDDEAGVASSDIAVRGNLLIHTWVVGDPTRIPEALPVPVNSGHVFVQVIDRTTGQLLLAPTRLMNAVGRHVTVLVEPSGEYAFVLVSYGGSLEARPVNLTTLAVEAPQVIASGLVNGSSHASRFDAVFVASGDLVVVYERDDATDTLTAVRLTRSGFTLTIAATEDLSEKLVKAISIVEDPSSSRVYVLYCHENATPDHRVRIRAINSSTLASALSPQSIELKFNAGHVSVHLVAAGSVLCLFSGSSHSGAIYPATISALVNASGGEVAWTRRRSSGVALLSRAFTVDWRSYVFARDYRYGERRIDFDEEGSLELMNVPSTSSYLLEVEHEPYTISVVGVPPHRMVGKVDHDIAGMFQTGTLPRVPTLSDTSAIAVVPFQASASQQSFNWRDGLRLVTVTTDVAAMADPWRSVQIGPETYIKSGVLQAWDGRTVFDYGMRVPIVLPGGTESASNGSMANGTYYYQFTSGFRSRAGVMHRGPYSVSHKAVMANTANAGQVAVRLAAHSIDGKQRIPTGFGTQSAGATYLHVHRTVADGSAMHLLTYAPRFNVITNEPSQPAMTFVDVSSDQNVARIGGVETPAEPNVPLDSRPLRYADTGELEDVQPPAQYGLHLHNGRLGLITGGRREYWFSKDFRENPGIAPGFNPGQVELYDEDLVGCASMDEKRVMFSESRIWFVIGDGPTVAGTDNRFTPPQLIQSDVGCTNPRSIVSWPGGVIFQHGIDVFNLNRGLQVEWIGKDARDTFATYNQITSAVLVASEGEIRFTCNGAERTYERQEDGSYEWTYGDVEGRIVVYDYARKTWMTRMYPGRDAIVDAAVHDGVYYFATTNNVRRETIDLHLDDGAYVPSEVRLAPIAPMGPIAWQRVRRAHLMGTSVSNHQITIAIARDFSESAQQTKTFVAGSDVTAVGPLERAQVDLTVQKVQAVEIRISDAAPANANAYPLGTGGGFTLDGVALLVQPKSGLPRTTPSRRG